MDKKYQLDYIWNKINKIYNKIKEYNLIEIIGTVLGIVIPISIFLLNLIETTVKNGYEKYFGLTGINIIWNTFSFWALLIIYCLIIAFFLIGNIVLEICLKKTKIIEKCTSRVVERGLIAILFYIMLQYLILLLTFLIYINNNIVDISQMPFLESFIFIFSLFTILHISVNENPFNCKVNGSIVFLILLSTALQFWNKNSIDGEFYLLILVLLAVMFIKVMNSIIFYGFCIINFLMKNFSNFSFKNKKINIKDKVKKILNEEEHLNKKNRYLASYLITVCLYALGGFVILNQLGMTIGNQPRYYSIVEYKGKKYVMFNTQNNEKIIMEIEDKDENEYTLVEKGTYQYLIDFDNVKVRVQECVIDNGDE